MTTTLLDPAHLRARGFEVLVESLGWVNAVRFVQQFESSTLNYTAERDKILPRLDAQQLMDHLDSMPSPAAPPSGK